MKVFVIVFHSNNGNIIEAFDSREKAEAFRDSGALDGQAYFAIHDQADRVEEYQIVELTIQ